MASNTPMIIPRVVQNSLVQYLQSCNTMLASQWNVRNQMRELDLQYMREVDWTATNQKAKLANRYGDASKLQNLTVPIILPAVEAAVTYQSSVFLTGTPIFGCVANPEFEDAAMGIEAIMEENSTRGGWIRHLQMFFRDGFKYNLSAIEASWEECTTWSLTTDSQFAGGKQGKPKEIIWAGNTLKRLDPYNIIFDIRVPLTHMSEYGEFTGYTELVSRVGLHRYFQSLPNKLAQNIDEAFASGAGSLNVNTSSLGSYYIPPLNSQALINLNSGGGTDWMSWATHTANINDMQQKNSYQRTTLYAWIIPEDHKWKVPNATIPQIWKLVFINQKVLVYAERQTNAHNRLPILFGQPMEDGLSYQTKSYATNQAPIQAVTSALMNSVVAARRRSVADRGLYDPSRVTEANINSDNPSAKIPVRPMHYGKPLNEAYYPIPFRDDQSQFILQEIGQVARMGDMLSGSNPAKQGQFVKGNKTQTEFSDVMAHSNGRDQNISILYEAQVFTPVKEIFKLNILQYQGPDNIFYKEKQQSVNIDPVKLRNAVIAFKMSDGLSPASKLINGDTFQVALQVIGSSPQIGSGYNIGPMFSYLMKTQGAQIAEFEKSKEQVAYEQAMNSWTQMAQLAISKGQVWQQPQPMPEQFGYLVNGKLKQTDEKPNALSSFQQSLANTAAAVTAQGAQ